jgi:hypothetical protein
MLNYGPKIVTDGLVLALDAGNKKSYPGSGTTWFDLSGNGNTRTLTNGPSFNSGNGGSIVFDGVDDYVDLGDVGISSWASSLTISTWTYVPTGATWTNGFLTTIIGALGSFSGMYGLTHGTTEGNINFYVRGDNGSISSTTTVSRDVWNNLVGVWDGSVARLYHNGVLVSGPNGSTRTGVPDTASLTMARERAFFGAGTGAYYQGNIANALIYNRALSATEIQQNFNATRSRFGI